MVRWVESIRIINANILYFTKLNKISRYIASKFKESNSSKIPNYVKYGCGKDFFSQILSRLTTLLQKS